MSAKSSAGDSYSSVEKFFWKFAADIVGQKNVDFYTQEKYQPVWKWGGWRVKVASIGMVTEVEVGWVACGNG